MDAEEILDADDLAALSLQLGMRPAANLPLLAALEEARGRFLAVRDEAGRFGGVALLEEEGLAYLSARGPCEARALGKALRGRAIDVLLADRRAADRAWRALSWSPPRLILDQAIYALSTPPPALDPLPLRPARPAELSEVQRIAQAMFWEEVGLPPALPTLHAHIEEELEEGSLRVYAESDRLLFVARVAVRCKAGAELQRVYTAPSRRREGIATRGIATLCNELLRELPRVVLRVNESNQGAIRLYRKLGFSRAGRIRLMCR